MANVDNPNGFFAVANLGGGAIPIWHGTTKSNLTLAAGDALIVATTGLIDIAGATSASILGVCTKAITGVTGTQKTVDFVPALPSIVFEGQCSGTAAQTDMYEKMDIEGTTGIMELNENSNSYNVAMPIGLVERPSNAIGANARLLFIWTNSAFTGQA
jgi:hypothetical protein